MHTMNLKYNLNIDHKDEPILMDESGRAVLCVDGVAEVIGEDILGLEVGDRVMLHISFDHGIKREHAATLYLLAGDLICVGHYGHDDWQVYDTHVTFYDWLTGCGLELGHRALVWLTFEDSMAQLDHEDKV